MIRNAGWLGTWPILLGVVLAVTAGGRSDPPAAAQTAGPPTGPTRRVPVDGGGAYTDVGAAGLAAMLRSQHVPLINVHVPYEGEIEETDQFFPFDRVEANLDRLPADKGARLVLYCRSGRMSAIAARALVKRGYADVWNLDGGMIAWQQAGYRLIHKAR